MSRVVIDQENGFCEHPLARAAGIQALEGLQDQLRNFELSLVQGLFESQRNGLSEQRFVRSHRTASFGRRCIDATASNQWKVKPKLLVTSWRRPIFVGSSD
jgi:hypothetical protein